MNKKTELMIKLLINSYFGDSIRKDNLYKHEIETEGWMESEYDEGVEEYHKLKFRDFVLKIKKDEEKSDDETSKSKGMLSQIGPLFLSNSKRTKKQIIKIIDVLGTDSVSYT